MEISEVVEAIKAKCSDSTGHLYKDHFRVALVLMVIDLYQKNSLDPAKAEALNRIIRTTLGPGQSLQSCIQFFKGEKARPIVAKYQAAYRNKETVSSVSKEFSDKPTVH